MDDLGLVDFTDFDATRESVFNAIPAALSGISSVENQRFTLSLGDLRYNKPVPVSLKKQKEKLLRNESLNWKLHGKWKLTDKSTGQTVDELDSVIANVPYMTSRGTFIRNGTEYTITRQARLKPGIYTRRKESGELEGHVNPAQKTGRQFRVTLIPETGKFKLSVGQANLPLIPALRLMGVEDTAVLSSIGSELYEKNSKHDARVAAKLLAQFGGPKLKEADPDSVTSEQYLEMFTRMKLDPAVTKRTLGTPYENVTPDTILRVMQKLVAIQRGEAQTDDRDSLTFQTLHSVGDFLNERVRRDAGSVMRKLLWKATRRGDLGHIQSGSLDPHVQGLLDSSFAMPLEQINPLEIFDQHHRVVRIGEGGISSVEAVPDEARNVQPSQLNFVDPIRGPESSKIGTDTRVAYGTLMKDGRLYSRFKDRKGGIAVLSPEDVADSVIAFPGEMEGDEPHVRVIDKGRIRYASRDEVDYEVPDAASMFSTVSNMVPMIQGSAGGRLLMGAKTQLQAVPLRKAEAPYVQSSVPDDENTSFESLVGRHLGAIRSKASGTVTKMTPDEIVVRGNDGRTHRHELYQNFPFNRKTFLHNTAMVRVGDSVDESTLLAKSNYTDDEGTAALGTNLRVAYSVFDGQNYEDGIVISESAAQALSSEHMYTRELGTEEGAKIIGKSGFISIHPGKFKRHQLDVMDKNGIILPGTIVRPGDPLILALSEKRPTGASLLYRPHKLTERDASITWEHLDEGLVTDVVDTKNGWKIAIKAYSPMQVGDKLSGRYGDKGTIASIIPDDQMLRDGSGNVMDVILNPLGIISRRNPSQAAEAALGKIVQETGIPYKVKGFSPGHMIRFAMDELKKHGMSDTEDLFDPVRNAKVKNVFVGNRFFLKLHHTTESKESGRSVSGEEDTLYTSDRLPAKGGKTGAKRLSVQDINALISYGATDVIRDAHLITGRRNDDYWRAVRLGYDVPTPGRGFIHDKFVALLAGAGINVHKKGNALNIMALTRQDIDDLSQGDIQNNSTVDPVSLDPKPGGLFDVLMTGGHDGTGWTTIKLSEPMPSPVMEKPIRHLLNLTQKQYEDVLAGRLIYDGKTGPSAITDSLERLNLKRLMLRAEEDVRSGRVTKRDRAIKMIGYLTMFKETGIRPVDLVWDRVPVLPPAFRPVSRLTNKVMITADANSLYRDLFDANEALASLRGKVDDEQLADERLTTYNAIKAVVGLGDPVGAKTKQQNLRGLLGQIFGRSPKYGIVQRKMISTPQDMVGRAVIAPDPSLDMDEVGLPERKAWTIYAPFIMRRLVRGGASALSAAEMVERRSSTARTALLEELRHRPVLINRAPVLHRYSIQAAWPKLTKGGVLRIPPIVTAGFNADFDGDSCSMDTRLLLRVHGLIVSMTAREFLEQYADHKPGQYESKIWELDGVETLNVDGTWSDVIQFTLHSNKKKLWAIKLRDNTVLKVTGDHSLMVGGKPIKPADLKIGDHLDRCTPPTLDGGVPYKNAFEMGYLDGYFLGDGCTTDTVVAWASAEPDFRRQLIRTIETAWGLKAFELKNAIHVGSKNHVRRMRELFGRYANAKFISPLVLNSEPDYLWGLVGGYMDADGSVEKTRSGSYLVRFWSISKSLVDSFSIVLYLLGVPHSVRFRNRSGKSDVWVTSVGRDGIKMFANHFHQKSRKLSKIDAACFEYQNRKTEKRSLLHSATRVEAVEEVAAEDWVFDLSSDGTFAVENGISVHNTMQYFVPVSEAARRQAIDRMLPSRNLVDSTRFKVHFVPRQEYLFGLHAASSRRRRGKPRIFRSSRDVIAAYHRGILNSDDTVIISE